MDHQFPLGKWSICPQFYILEQKDNYFVLEMKEKYCFNVC